MQHIKPQKSGYKCKYLHMRGAAHVQHMCNVLCNMISRLGSIEKGHAPELFYFIEKINFYVLAKYKASNSHLRLTSSESRIRQNLKICSSCYSKTINHNEESGYRDKSIILIRNIWNTMRNGNWNWKATVILSLRKRISSHGHDGSCRTDYQ